MTENNNNTNNSGESTKKIQRRNTNGSNTKLDDFANFEQIGRGAFGQVYRATYKRLGREFALKKISKKEIQNQFMISQLSNEIQISKSLKHDNIIKLYDYFQENDHFYLVLDYASGGQLYSKLMKKGRFSEQEAKNYIRDVVSAVKYLHSRDPPIIHRDIKPENLLMDQTGRVKLADFGWSNFSNKPRKTYCGTVHYLAPEMIDKSGHDQKLDIWCIGVLAYELLTGKTPFMPKQAKNEAMIKKQMEENILNVRIEFPEDFPTQAKSFVLGMVKRNPKQRMSMNQIQNHPWLQKTEEKLATTLPPQKGSRSKSRPSTTTNIPLEQDTKYIDELKKKINDLQYQLRDIKASPNRPQTQSPDQNTERVAIAKQLKQLRVTRDMNQAYKKDIQKLANDIKLRDKQVILLKSKLSKYQQLQSDLERADGDKKQHQQKLKKLQRQLENSKLTQKKLRQEIDAMSDTIPNKVKNGTKIQLKQMNSEEFIYFVQEQLQILSEKFQENKKILNKVMERERVNQEKENQLIRLRVQQKNFKEQIRAELKEQYQAEKDEIVLSLRDQLAQERQKWFRDYIQLKNMYDGNNTSSTEDTSRVSDRQNDLMFQVRNLKEVNSSHQKIIKKQDSQIKDLQQMLKRKK